MLHFKFWARSPLSMIYRVSTSCLVSLHLNKSLPFSIPFYLFSIQRKTKEACMFTVIYFLLVIYHFTQIYRVKSNQGCLFKKRLGLMLQNNKGDLPGFTFSAQVGYPHYPYGSKAWKHPVGWKYGSEDCGFRTLQTLWPGTNPIVHTNGCGIIVSPSWNFITLVCSLIIM
jgi:hypothetical protein